MEFSDVDGWCRLCGNLDGAVSVIGDLEEMIVDYFKVNLS